MTDRPGLPGRLDDRGVSTTISYVLTLAITVVLTGSLLFAVGGALDDRAETTARDELEVSGQHLAARLMAADRLAETGADTVVVRGTLPARTAGSPYTIAVQTGGGDQEIVLNATEMDVSVRVEFVTRRTVVETTIRSNEFEIVLTDAGELEVRAA